MRHRAHAVVVALSDGGALAMLGLPDGYADHACSDAFTIGFVALVVAAVVGVASRRDQSEVVVGAAVAAALVAGRMAERAEPRPANYDDAVTPDRTR